MGKLDDALQSFLQARPLREKIGDPFYIVSDLAELSSLYAKIGKTQDGIATATKALQIAKENEIDAKLPMIYTALADNYEAEKDFQKAAEVYKKLDALKDSMYADANPKALAEMQAKYETEKKERTIEQQQVRIRTQNFLFAGIVILVVLSGLLIYSLYKRYRLRQETHLKTELMKQQEHAAKAVIEAEEEERQRIAKDLHDGVGQMMSAAKMNLSALESEVQFSDQEQKNSLDKIIQLVDESCKEVRQVSHNMMPNVLMKKNLAAAIADFIDKLDKKKLQVHLYTERLEDRLDSGVETVLYRVIQESVNNVIRHSGATELDISITRDKEGIHATIEDNGSGFDINDKEKREGIGLKNITTRVEYLKGTVDFDSAPGRGTVVGLFIPLTDLKQ
jgi:signal transduction histidine kinase